VFKHELVIVFTLSVEIIPVGSLPVKSVSTIVILGKIPEISTFVARSSSGLLINCLPNFYHFVTNFRHFTSYMILKSNQGLSKTYQGMSGGSFTPGNGHGWHCG
jgi:hypothetical protein